MSPRRWEEKARERETLGEKRKNTLHLANSALLSFGLGANPFAFLFGAMFWLLIIPLHRGKAKSDEEKCGNIKLKHK